MLMDSLPDKGLRILCLDGGDARCVSQLYILQEFMYRLEQKTGVKTRPCDYFHLITGVDTSAPIAAFLGLFGMTVEEALDAFFRLYTTVFADDGDPAVTRAPKGEVSIKTDPPETRASRLEAALKELMKSQKYGIPENAMLSDPVFRSTPCKVALCYAPAAHIDHCRMFRNYQSPQQSGTEVTLVEALRAAWATPGLIAPKLVGPTGREEELVSAVNGFNNPIQEAIKEAYTTFGPDARIACLLSLGSGQRGVISLDEKDVTPRKLGMQMVTDSDIVAEEVRKRIGRLRIYHRLSVDRGLEGWELFRRGFGVIKSHVDAYLSKDAVNGILEDCLNVSRSVNNVSMERIYRSRAKGRGAAHGLPPLSAFFVMREAPMRTIVNALLDCDENQRIMVLSGLGGSGKTQLALKFSHDYEDSFDHIFFIDASSSEGIEKELVDRVRRASGIHTPQTVQEALEVLSTEEDFTRNWLIVLDNADDPTVNLSDYFPPCKYGSILITTRNVILENLAPDSHLILDVMSADEAVTALLAAVFPSTTSSNRSLGERGLATASPSKQDREVALEIVEHLAFFPIAVVQAGCYIRQQGCLHDYVNRFKENRLRLLQRPTRFQLDKLKYPHSVYAAFNTTAEAVSPRALQLLGILSFGHFSNFPRPIFGLASKVKFSYEMYDLLDRTPEFQRTIQFLTNVLCPSGIWDEDELDTLLEELQQFSLITLVPVYKIVVLRLHPMTHGWARDRLTDEEQNTHRAAFVRLLVCASDPNNGHLSEYLDSHLEVLSQSIDSLHVNDRAALARTLLRDGRYEENLRVWRNIYQEVEQVHGKMHVQTSRAMLHFADAYSGIGDRQRMEAMEREVIEIREALLGKNNLETAKARANLARTFRINGDYASAEEVEKGVLRTMIETVGVMHLETVQGMIDLALTWECQGRHEDEQALLLGIVDNLSKNLGRSNIRTIRAIHALANCYHSQGKTEKSEKLRMETVELNLRLFGNQHISTVTAMGYLAMTYFEQQRYKESEALRRSELTTRKELQGTIHVDTLVTMSQLARTLFEQARYGEAEALWEEEKALRREFHADNEVSILNALFWQGRSRYQSGRYKEAEECWLEHLARCRVIYRDVHDETLDVLYMLARTCFDQMRYAEAEAYWKEELAGRLLVHKNHEVVVLNTMDWLGEVAQAQNRYDEAEAYWKQELFGRQIIHGNRDSETLRVVHWCGEAAFNAKRYEDARKWWAQEVIDRRVTQGETHPDTLKAMHWCARACFMLDQYKDAIGWLEQELAGQKQVHGDINPDVLLPMFYLGKAHYLLGDYEEAELYWKDELAGRQVLHGDIHDETLGTIYWLSQLCIMQSRFGQAEEWSKKEIAGRQALGGENSPEALTAMHTLGTIYYKQNRYKETEEWWRRELAGRRSTEGENHENYLMTLKWLGESLFQQSLYNEAETYWKEAAIGYRELRGRDHDETITLERWLGDAYFAMDKYEDAATWWIDMLPGCTAMNGETGADALLAKFNIGKAYYRAKKYGEADKWLNETLRGIRVEEGEEHINALYSMHFLGDIAYRQGRYQEAEETWKMTLDKWKARKDGDHNSEIFQTYSYLGDAMFCTGRFTEAEKWWRRELSEREAAGEDEENRLRAIHWLGEARWKQSDYAGAEEFWRREVAGLEKLYEDEKHNRVLEVKHGIARACMIQGRQEEAESIWKAILDARSAEGRTVQTAKVNRHLAQLYYSSGRFIEAKRTVEEAILTLKELDQAKETTDAPVSALKELTDPDSTLLSESIALLKSIDVVLPRDGLLDTNTDEQRTAGQLSIPEIELQDGASDDGSTITENASLPDPGGDPRFAFDASANVALPIIRPRSPFNMRATLGARPTSWSMF